MQVARWTWGTLAGRLIIGGGEGAVKQGRRFAPATSHDALIRPEIASSYRAGRPVTGEGRGW